MAEHIGIVIKKESNRYVRVITDRKGACGGCHATAHGCRGCLTSSKMESRVANPLGAEPGDLVKVHLSSRGLFTGAAILYLLPVLGLLSGAFTGTWAAAAYGVAESFGSVGGAVAGLAMGFVGVIALDRSPRVRSRIMPTITAIVKTKVGLPKIEKETCCG